MNYGKKVESPSAGSYLSHGINENVVALKGEYIETDTYKAVDIYLGTSEDKAIKHRIFEFKANPSFDASAEQQEDKFLQNIKSLMSETIGKDNYDKAISKATDFKTFATILCSMCKDKNPKTLPFRLMLINKENKTNGKNYAVVPTSWAGGFTESMEVNPTKLKFDESKYGSKKKDESKVENTSTGSTEDNKMPWE